MGLATDPVHLFAVLQGLLEDFIADVLETASSSLADTEVEVPANPPSDLVQPRPHGFGVSHPRLLASATGIGWSCSPAISSLVPWRSEAKRRILLMLEKLLVLSGLHTLGPTVAIARSEQMLRPRGSLLRVVVLQELHYLGIIQRRFSFRTQSSVASQNPIHCSTEKFLLLRL